MMIELPWENIVKPSEQLNVRRVSPSRKLQIFWARDYLDRYLLLIECERSGTEVKGVGRLRGISVDLRRIDESLPSALVIALEEKKDVDIFNSLCRSLISALGTIEDARVAYSISIEHLKRWKVFLAGKGKQLSNNQVRGLVAELLVLERLLTLSNDHGRTIKCWKGPELYAQDFVMQNAALEVKAVHGSDRNAVTISSEDQLATNLDHLYLLTVTLAETSGPAARSLNALVQSIRDVVVGAEELNELDRRLEMVGYIALDEYSESRFEVLTTAMYEVTTDFPKITRTSLPKGLRKVIYQIDISEIERFKVSSGNLAEVVDGGA